MTPTSMGRSDSSFIFVGSVRGKLENRERKIVRRYCMRSRNTKPDTTKSLDHKSYGLPSAAKKRMSSFEVQAPLDHNPQTTEAADEERNHDLPAVRVTGENLSKRIISRLWLPFPDFTREDTAASFSVIYNNLPCIMRAFTICDFSVTVRSQPSPWHDWFFLDDAYAHSSMIFACAVFENVIQQGPSQLRMFHTSKAIRQVNTTLSDSTLFMRNSNIAAVICLAFASFVSHDYHATASHATGLRQIVLLRGGIENFKQVLQLLVGMSRIDLCLSLAVGRHVIFTSNPLPRHEICEAECSGFYALVPPTLVYERSISHLVNLRVSAIFQRLQNFAFDLNNFTSGGKAVSEEDVYRCLISAQYELFELENQCQTALDECVRMSLLVMLASVFQVHKDLKVQYDFAASQLQEICLQVDLSIPDVRELMVWVLMMGALSVFNCDEAWLREKWRAVLQGVSPSWGEVRGRLQSYIWINQCHDGSGWFKFERMMLS
ncbi:unnamed protein product [Clonostachys rosea]|uniref:Transcription factor domain-containing protein n=1 Tax=Bionectria ochroleuca TaxID=29856 RepID=A0ABY6UVG7_BIOOC|nr:unnamed protein product [Clonostachys rosea]